MTASPPPSTGKPTPSPPQSPGTRRGFLVEAWKLGGLEAWLSRWGSAPHPRSPPSPAGALRGRGRFGASRLHALFSVLRSPGRPCRPSPFPKAWRAKPAMPYRPPGPDVRLARTHGPPPPRLSFVSFVSFVISKTIWQFCVRQHAKICTNLRDLRFPFWQSFVCLRGPSCSSCQPRRAPLPHPSQRPHLCGKHAAPLKNTLQKGLYLLS